MAGPGSAAVTSTILAGFKPGHDEELRHMANRMTLPDLLRDGLDIVFIGINPSVYSVTQGHYFARKTNRFWPAFSRSMLSAPARQALGVEQLTPVHDVMLQDHGIGFTDVVKRATARADELEPTEFAEATRELVAKLESFQPRIACFHGMMGYRPFVRLHAPTLPLPVLGEQTLRLGRTRLFVIPNPSPANAHASPVVQTEWYDRIAAALEQSASTAHPCQCEGVPR